MTTPIRPAALAAAVALFACASAGAADVDRKVPDGTLTYRIVLDGEGGARPHDTLLADHATMHRSLEVTTRMKGHVATADVGTPAAGSGMDDLARRVEACGQDQACAMAIAMEMARNPGKIRQVQQESKVFSDAIGRDTVWLQSGSCHSAMVVLSAEKARFLDVGEGYATPVDGQGTREGKASIDCARTIEIARIHVEKDKGIYTLELPFAEVETWVHEDGQKKSRETRRIPAIKITGQPYVEGATLSGSKSWDALVFVDSTPVYGQGVHIPMHATLSWKFVPD